MTSTSSEPRPLPAGSLVRGTIGLGEAHPGESSLVIRGSCRGHVWRVGAATPSNWSSGSGWLQVGTCLVCEYTTAPMDCEWWQEKATVEDLAKANQLVVAEMGRLRKVHEVLVELSVGDQGEEMGMMNFE